MYIKCTGIPVEFAREVKGQLQYACVLHADLFVTSCCSVQVDLELFSGAAVDIG